jgi:dienelactone hydrolase
MAPQTRRSFLQFTPLGLSALALLPGATRPAAVAREEEKRTATARRRSEPPVIRSSWDDLLEGVSTRADWDRRRAILKQRYLDLIRDEQKPPKPPLDLTVHESQDVGKSFRRLRVSYNVESDERAHAYIGIPLGLREKAPAVVTLHGTYKHGARVAAGLLDSPDERPRAHFEYLCPRGFVCIAPEHFVSGERIPAEGPYDTTLFYKKHPNWNAVGKFTYEHSIAIDVLETMKEVDPQRIGAMGHSLGGHGTYFLAAYDERIKAAACNCGASFFRHNHNVDAWARDHWYVYFKQMRPGLLKGELPSIDIHEIIATIAPRAFLDLSGFNDGDPLTQRQRALMLLKLADVYELVGSPENLSFYSHGRKHSVAHESRALIAAFLDAHLMPNKAT